MFPLIHYPVPLKGSDIERIFQDSLHMRFGQPDFRRIVFEAFLPYLFANLWQRITSIGSQFEHAYDEFSHTLVHFNQVRAGIVTVPEWCLRWILALPCLFQLTFLHFF